MHRPQFFTWTTHTAEATTLLEATRLQKLYTYMCNIVTEFYLYSIVYIYLINSRLDVTHSVRHHFRTIQTLSALTFAYTLQMFPGQKIMIWLIRFGGIWANGLNAFYEKA